MSRINDALHVSLLIGKTDPADCSIINLVGLELELANASISNRILDVLENKCRSVPADYLIFIFEKARHHSIRNVLSRILQEKLQGLKDSDLPPLIHLCPDFETERDVVFEIRKRKLYRLPDLLQLYDAVSFQLLKQWVACMIAEHSDSTVEMLVSKWFHCHDQQTRQILLDAAMNKLDFDANQLVCFFSRVRFADMRKEILDIAKEYQANLVVNLNENP